MPSWRSRFVSQIGWQIKTGASGGAGTDDRITVEVLRGNESIITLNVEMGETERLNRDNDVFHWWDFDRMYWEPGDIVEWIGGLPYPNAVEFSDDVHGVLRCRFRAHGDDAWEKDSITVMVKYAERHFIEGTIDAFEWKDGPWTAVGWFPQDVTLSTDPAEGVSTWTLNS